MALGATKGNVLSLFIGQELKLVLSGIAVGTLGAFLLARTLSSWSYLLYGVESGDPLTFAVASIGLIAAAAWLVMYPLARRPAKVDPLVALRYE
jgi:putative ABC transport system permease protein